MYLLEGFFKKGIKQNFVGQLFDLREAEKLDSN